MKKYVCSTPEVLKKQNIFLLTSHADDNSPYRIFLRLICFKNICFILKSVNGRAASCRFLGDNSSFDACLAKDETRNVLNFETYH